MRKVNFPKFASHVPPFMLIRYPIRFLIGQVDDGSSPCPKYRAFAKRDAVEAIFIIFYPWRARKSMDKSRHNSNKQNGSFVAFIYPCVPQSSNCPKKKYSLTHSEAGPHLAAFPASKLYPRALGE